jgi:hypothetical protein
MTAAESSSLTKKIEVAANVAIIVVAIAGAAIFVKNYWLKPATPQRIELGAHFGLKDANWQASGKTLIFGISTTCHFCTESAGFYRQLTQQCAERHVRTIALLPQPLDEAQSYLSKEGVSVDEVRRASLSDLQIVATPTLLLLDDKGVVRGAWFGKLSEKGEEDVLGKIGS